MEFSKSLAIDGDENARYRFNTKRLKEEYQLVPTSLAFFKSVVDGGSNLKPNYERLGIPYVPPTRPFEPYPYLDVTKW